MPHIVAYILVGLIGLLSFALEPALAEGSSDGSGSSGGAGTTAGNSGGNGATNANAALYLTAKQAVDAAKYDTAIPILQQITSSDPRNADAWNLLGFSNRKLGNMTMAAKAYKTALRINPGHLGALEYQGEMFVELGQIDKAKANLSTLQSLCGACEEMVDLQEAIDTAKS